MFSVELHFIKLKAKVKNQKAAAQAIVTALITGNDARRYAVQVSDTTMMIKEQMPVSK